MVEKSDRDEPSEDSLSKEIGRRDTLRLATLAAALGAGLSVSLHVEEASAEGAQVQLKFYRQQEKGEALLIYTATLPEDASKKLLEAPGLVQWKGYMKESAVGAGQMQFKLEQHKETTAPAAPPPAKGWDIKQNKKT